MSCSSNCRNSRWRERATFITEFLQREVQGFLRLAQPPAPTSRFLDLGTDSLMAVELRNRLHSQFGGKFTINATAVFDYPTIGGLGEYLAAQMPDAESESGDAAAAPSDAPAEASAEPDSGEAQAETATTSSSNGASKGRRTARSQRRRQSRVRSLSRPQNRVDVGRVQPATLKAELTFVG